MCNMFKQILAHMSALDQAPQSKSTKVGFGSKSGGEIFYSFLYYSTSTSSISNHDNDDRSKYIMNTNLPYFNGQLKIEEFLDGLAKGEGFFYYSKVPKESASAWWEQVQTTGTKLAK